MIKTYLKMPAWFFVMVAILLTILGMVIGLTINDRIFPPQGGTTKVIVIERESGFPPAEESKPLKINL